MWRQHTSPVCGGSQLSTKRHPLHSRTKDANRRWIRIESMEVLVDCCPLYQSTDSWDTRQECYHSAWSVSKKRGMKEPLDTADWPVSVATAALFCLKAGIFRNGFIWYVNHFSFSAAGFSFIPFLLYIYRKKKDFNHHLDYSCTVYHVILIVLISSCVWVEASPSYNFLIMICSFS